MKIITLYQGDSYNEYLIQEAPCFDDYGNVPSYLAANPNKLLKQLKIEGFDKTGIKKEIEHVGINYVIITVFLD